MYIDYVYRVKYKDYYCTVNYNFKKIDDFSIGKAPNRKCHMPKQ